MKGKLKLNNKGFTIVEVLIVLAIAGLILLIVFLAVPALQRNSRNTAIRNDAANVLSGVSEYVSNNNGTLPAAGSISVSGTDVSIGAAPNTVTSKVRDGTSAALVDNNTPPTATGAIVIHRDHGCSGNTATPKNRAIAATFLVETGNTSTVVQCTES
jgi:prepilin-type N-terminal cleavage/methylation domain-containing protein